MAAPTQTFGTSRKQHQANIERLTAAASASRLLQVDTKAAGRAAKELGKLYTDRESGEIDTREWPHRDGSTHARGEGSGAELRGMSLGQERVGEHTGSEGSASMSGVPNLERGKDYGRERSHHGEGSRSSMAQLDNRVVGGMPEAALHDERSESAIAIPARKTPDSFDRRRHPPSVPSTSSSRRVTAAVWIDLTIDSDDDDDDPTRAPRHPLATGGLGNAPTLDGAPQTSALAYLNAGKPGGGQYTTVRRLPYKRPPTYPPLATPVRQGRKTPLSSGRSEASPISSAGTAEDPIDFASLSDTDTEVDDPAAGADIGTEGHAAIGFDSMDADSLFAIGPLTKQVSHLDVGAADPIRTDGHDDLHGLVARATAPTLPEPMSAVPTAAAPTMACAAPRTAAPIPAEPRLPAAAPAPAPAATIMVPLTQLFVPRTPDPAAPSQSEPSPIMQARDLSQRIAAVNSKCKIVPIPSKGLGVVLTVGVAAGETILSEAPFLVAQVNDLEHRHWRVVSGYTHLDPTTQQLFDSFHPKGAHTGDRADIARLIDIWDTNAIPLGGADRQAEVTGFFKTISRLNHSCAPNTVWRWDEEEQAMRRSWTSLLSPYSCRALLTCRCDGISGHASRYRVDRLLHRPGDTPLPQAPSCPSSRLWLSLSLHGLQSACIAHRRFRQAPDPLCRSSLSMAPIASQSGLYRMGGRLAWCAAGSGHCRAHSQGRAAI